MDQVNSLRTEYKFKKTEIGKIPVDWEVKKLKDIADIIMGQSPPSSTCSDVENGLPFFQGKAEFGLKYPKIVKWCRAPQKIAENRDILISVRAPVGDVNIAPERSCIGRGLAAIRGIRANNDYLYFVLDLNKDRLKRIGQGSTFKAINRNVLFELKIPVPPYLEQKKIAEILSTADEAIEKKKEVIEKTKELKKGMMQELLTRGIGHKKFKKTELGEIPEEWEVVRVRDVCNRPGYGFTASATDKPIGPKFLRITDIQAGNVNWDAVPYCECPNTLINDYLLKSGDILFARTGATTGKSYIIKNCPKTVFASYLIRITTGERIIPDFLYQVFNSFFYWKQINQQIGGSAQGGVNASLLSHIKVPLPLISEQKRIIDILSSVEDEIDINIHDLVNIDNIKRGLMQELLTGKIRVIG